MMDRRYREEFTPFYFDLVINDEAHRSIYGDAREVVQFFQATRIGLTATPKAYLKNVNIQQLAEEDPKTLEARQLRDTYHYFGCEPGQPTFRYDIADAVQDPEGPFLCLPKIYDCRSDITTKTLQDAGWTVVVNEQEENFKIQDLERKIFTPHRNRVMCDAFLREAQRDPSGQIGKSIVFAVNQTHATAITKILNDMKPGIALTITSRIPDSSSLAKEFRDGKASNYVEGLASSTLGNPATGNTLGALAGRLTDWPHDKIRDSLVNLYHFCCDYPAIRHGGKPASARRRLATRDSILVTLLLMSFTGYLSPQMNEQSMLGV